MTSSFRPTTLILPAILAAMGTMTVASAQSASPFAKKNRTQAWETAPNPVPSVSPPVNTVPQSAPIYRPAPTPQAEPTNWQAFENLPVQTPSPVTAKSPAEPPADSGVYYPGRRNGGAKPAHNIGNYESKSLGGARPSQGFDSKNYEGQNYTARQPEVRYHDAAGNQTLSPNSGTSPYGDPNQPQWGQAQNQG